MTNGEIARAINPEYPGVYAPTIAPTKLTYINNSIKVGYFNYTDKSDKLEKENKFTFIEFNNYQNYKKTKDEKYITIVDGKQLKAVEYPSFPK